MFQILLFCGRYDARFSIRINDAATRVAAEGQCSEKST
jgi:hypothetical protein